MINRGEITFREEDHSYWKLGGTRLPSVTQVFGLCGLIDKKYFTSEARIRGDYVHKLCHYIDNNDLDWNSVDPELEGYLKAYIRFKKETGYKPILTEQIVYHSVHGFAGTPDKLGENRYGYVLPDIKTGDYKWYDELQTAAYKLCIKEDPNYKNIGKIHEIGLYLHKDGTYAPKVFSNYMNEHYFLACNAVAKLKLNNGWAYETL